MSPEMSTPVPFPLHLSMLFDVCKCVFECVSIRTKLLTVWPASTVHPACSMETLWEY